LSDFVDDPFAGMSRYWLLDFFGDILDFDPMLDRIYCRRLSGLSYPGLFFYADDAFSTPYDVSLRKIVSMPSPFPVLRAVEAGDSLIALEVQGEERPRYLRSLMHDQIDFRGEHINDWERFLPLSERLVHALLILANDQLSRIENAEGASLGPATFHDGFRIAIGGMLHALTQEHAALETIASLPSGANVTLSRETNDGPDTVVITRL